MAPGVGPFGTPHFLEALGGYGEGDASALGGLSGTPYLAKLFRAYPVWPLFSRAETRGAGVADYADLDWRRTTSREFEGFLTSFLASARPDILVLPRVREEAASGRLVEDFAASRGAPFVRLPYDVAPYTLLEGEWETFYGRKSRKFRYNLGRAERKLDEMGGLSFTHVAEPERIERELEKAFGIYSRRSAGRYRSALWLRADGREVLKRMAVQFAQVGWADLVFLEVGGRPIAFSYGFHNEQDYFFYATAFDASPAYAPYSPGVLLVKHLLEQAFQRGFRRFDFMLGDEPYKRTWATHQEAVYSLVLGKPAARSRLALRLYCTWLSLRQRARRASRMRAIVGAIIPPRVR